MERYVCIHCHFYQPPRENPWLEAVEMQDSASPYHDWNERVTAECYLPNCAARILDGESRIAQIVNNYSRISFNFGPTLLSWLEQNAPHAYEQILAADRQSQQNFSGHGSALSQAYNHMILPWANARDKQTQIVWGIRDFQHRFKREPEGMWLPETAVDIQTLELLSGEGVKFSILAPHQAQRMRSRPWEAWWSVEGGRIDPTRAYRCYVPSGRFIDLFFYDGPISCAVAFENLLADGERFANRLLSGFNDARRWPQIVHIATDGETYGHHYPHGTWHSHTHSTTWSRSSSHESRIIVNTWPNTRHRRRSKSWRIPPGVARTGLPVGRVTADAGRALAMRGINNGVGHCAEPWTG